MYSHIFLVFTTFLGCPTSDYFRPSPLYTGSSLFVSDEIQDIEDDGQQNTKIRIKTASQNLTYWQPFSLWKFLTSTYIVLDKISTTLAQLPQNLHKSGS
jgi:hypothetical protein